MLSLATPQKSHGQFRARAARTAESRSLKRTKPRMELPENMTSNTILPDWIAQSEDSQVRSDFKETMMLG